MEDSAKIKDEKITITCPRCGYKFEVLTAQLDDDDEIPCPNCEMLIEID